MARTVTALTRQPLELGEGPRLVDGRLVLVDILDGSLYEHPGDVPADPVRLLQLDVPLGAVAPVRGSTGSWIASAGEGVAVLGSDGSVEWLGRPESRHRGATRMNDGVADSLGRFWAGSCANDFRTPLGALYRVDPDGSVHQVLDDLVIANGPAVSDDGRTLFLADTGRGTITRYRVDDDGTPTDPVLVLSETSGAGPDGLTLDGEGHLWVAFYGGGQVRRYDPDGRLLLSVDLPASQPTSVALLDGRAVVTTARQGLDSPTPSDGLLLSIDLRDLPGITARPARCWGPPSPDA